MALKLLKYLIFFFIDLVEIFFCYDSLNDFYLFVLQIMHIYAFDSPFIEGNSTITLKTKFMLIMMRD